MSATILYPYRRLVGSEVRLELASDVTSRPDGSADLSSTAVEELELTLRVDERALKRCLHNGETVDVVSAVVRVISTESRRRDIVKVLPPVTDDFLVELPSGMHRGRVDIQAYLVRNVDYPDSSDGNATVRGTSLGESEVVTVHFDEPNRGRGASLDIRWLVFSSEPRFEEMAGNIFAIDDDLDPPRILLNSGISGLHKVLTNTGARGRDAKIRDAVFAQIALQVWTSLLADALAAVLKSRVELDIGKPSSDDIIDNVGGWRADVIRDWAGHLMADGDDSQALDRLVEHLAEGSGDVLLARVPAAIQSRLDTPKSFRGLLAEAQLFDKEA